MKKAFLLALFSLTTSTTLFATYTTHYDYQSGNQYNVNRVGNSTFVNGSNANTGSYWNQTSTSVGNSTFTNGYDKDGNYWNQTSQTIGNTTFVNGYDSDGNYYNYRRRN